MQCNIYTVMDPVEAEKLRVVLETQDWKVGQARTEELTGYIKRNKELRPKVDGELITALSEKASNAITTCEPLVTETQLLKMTRCKFNKFDAEEYEGGAEYKRHTDAPWMGPCRTDFTMVLALSDSSSYEGGEHHVDVPSGADQIFTLEAGQALVYETGYAHWVAPVTKGTRICALSWIESQVGTERQRGILATIRGMSRELEAEMLENKDDPRFRKWFVDIGVIHSGLHRMWAHRA